MLVPFNASGEAAAPVARLEGCARAGPLPYDPLERDHGRTAAHGHPRGGRCRDRNPGRRPRNRRRARQLGPAGAARVPRRCEELRDGSGRLLEGVPQHGVATGTVTTSSRSPSARAMRVEQVVVRQVRVRSEHEQRRHPDRVERRRRGRQFAYVDDARLRVAVPPSVLVLDEVHSELGFDELPGLGGAGSPRSAARSRSRSSYTRSAARSLRPRARCGGSRIAGSSRTSASTEPGRRAACSNASRPPNECPIQARGVAQRPLDGVEVVIEPPWWLAR